MATRSLPTRCARPRLSSRSIRGSPASDRNRRITKGRLWNANVPESPFSFLRLAGHRNARVTRGFSVTGEWRISPQLLLDGSSEYLGIPQSWQHGVKG